MHTKKKSLLKYPKKHHYIQQLRQLPHHDMLIEICKTLQFNEVELISFQLLMEQIGWTHLFPEGSSGVMKDFAKIRYMKKDSRCYSIFLSSLMHLLFVAYAVKVSFPTTNADLNSYSKR